MSREPQWDEDDELYQCPDEDEICAVCADCGRVGSMLDECCVCGEPMCGGCFEMGCGVCKGPHRVRGTR